MAILGLVLGIEANPQMLNVRKGFQPKKRGVDLGDILKRKRNCPQPINREKQTIEVSELQSKNSISVKPPYSNLDIRVHVTHTTSLCSSFL